MVGWWQPMRTRAMRHRALLACRSPPRCSRCRSVRPDDTGIGDTMLRVTDSNGELVTTVPRTSTGEISRFKAYGSRHSH